MTIGLSFGVGLGVAGHPGTPGGQAPENQVFQYMASASFTFGAGETASTTGYLWIPPESPRVRGVLVLGRNVPEHGLVGHPAIRAVCAETDLAILWCCPSFLMSRHDNAEDHARFLQQLLDALAAESGYDEVATAPWLPMGESMHLLMVNRLINARPERCIAGVHIKNGRLDLQPQADGVPVLSAIGTCDEWDQEKKDLLNQWRDMSFLRAFVKRRTAVPQWPGSLLIEPGSGHFECTETMTCFIADYIRAAVSARLPDGGSATPRPVNLDDGYVVGPAVPGREQIPPTPYRECLPENRTLPWFFSRDLARVAWDSTVIDWTMQTQVPVFADADGNPIPFQHRGITIPLPYTTEDDGVSFQLRTTFLASIPPGFVHAGTPLGHAPGKPTIDWICGHVASLGDNRFRIALDRTWGHSPTFVRVSHPGNGTYRPSLQPAELRITPNRTGTPQVITFEPVPDPPAGTRELQLSATSDSRLPVSFFVRSGPAYVDGSRLVFTPIPPRSRLPVTVTVVAWQWGRAAEPAVQTAPLVERSFRLNARPAAGNPELPAAASQEDRTETGGQTLDIGTEFDLQEFIDTALAAGGKQVIVPPGRYRVKPRNCEHLRLVGLNGVEIVADGVEMICTETTRALTVTDCTDLKLRGLTIDYDPLPYTQGRIIRLSDDNTVHDIELFDGYPAAEQVRDFKYEIFRPDTRTLRFGSYHQFSVEALDAKHIRVTRSGRYMGEQVGDIIAIGTSCAPGGQSPHAVYASHCSGVVLEEITLYASNCFGFLETDCRATRYVRCRIDRRPPETDFRSREAPRLRSLNADAFHSKHATVGPRLESCTARFMGDDAINICGDYHMVMASDGPRLRVLAKRDLNIRAGDPVEVVSYDGRRLPDARAVATREIGEATTEELAFLAKQRMHAPFREGKLGRVHDVVVERDLALPMGSVICSANRIGNGFSVVGCDFGFNRSRGILIKASHGEIRNNRLEGCWGEAIKVAPEFWWLEAGSSSDIRITDNRILDCLGKGIAVYAVPGKGGIAPAGAHRDIVIEGNVVTNTAQASIWVTSTHGLVLRNNRVDAPATGVVIENCEAVERADAE